MTKKHFEAIAKALRSSKPTLIQYGSNGLAERRNQWDLTAASITVAIREFHPQFNQEKFEQAAGLVD